MKAAAIKQTGPPETIEMLDLPRPQATDSQVLVRVEAVDVNPIDTYVRSGMVAMPLPLPYIVGCELDYDARGFAWLNGRRVSDVDADASRLERIAARYFGNSGLLDCAKYGYLMGKDEVATQGGYEALLGFLEKGFALTPAAAARAE